MMGEKDIPMKRDLKIYGSNRDACNLAFAKMIESAGIESYIHACDLLRNLRAIFGDDKLKKRYGEKYTAIIKKINKVKLYTHLIDSYLRGLKNKTIESNNITNARFKEYKKACLKLPLLQQEFFDCIFLMIMDSDLVDASINNIHRLVATKSFKNMRLITEDGDLEKSEDDEDIMQDEI